MDISGSSSSPFGLTSPVSHSMTPVLEPYRPPIRTGHGPQAMHTPRVPVVCFLALLNQQLAATERVSVPTAFTPHTVVAVAAQPRAVLMMTATSRNLELLRAGEREERDKKFIAVVSLRGWSAAAHTLSVNHNPSGTFAFYFQTLERRPVP
ncbi:hypothetical protein Landi51_11876 [Colletotrichum acutatum]